LREEKGEGKCGKEEGGRKRAQEGEGEGEGESGQERQQRVRAYIPKICHL